MAGSNSVKTHYQVLRVQPTAAEAEIKLAYRQLAKQYHPDCNPNLTDRDQMIAINLAYEVLSNPASRARYDQNLGGHRPGQQPSRPSSSRKTNYRQQDQKFHHWCQRVYEPCLQIMQEILENLDLQIDLLADDPFDDQLMADFEDYLDDTRRSLVYMQSLFRHYPNPGVAAGVAEYLYYALSHLGDGMEELNYFSHNYDDHHLHTGQEMWRLVAEMCDRAQAAMAHLGG
ncbi:MAG: DnaJ domain-containing protein [Pseudanabaenaceae cyanobacterium bins.68]|nr:DnaJ domain-containing protein [Pseudanabaenaceae cyanobacterium bins.68]